VSITSSFTPVVLMSSLTLILQHNLAVPPSQSGKIEAQSGTVEIRELPAGETHLAHPAMLALRTANASEREFVEHVDGVLRPGGYRLVGAFVPDRTQAVAVAGFRTSENLAWGHHLYVDDLSTAPHARRQGHAGALLDWLVDEGRRLGCAQLHLDSGTGPERFDAHRLYHNHGLAIYSHHFARGL
jgi:GNAT superfamily N-acetyltransferase